MELKNKKILIVGLARTGVESARFFKNRGAFVTVTDMAKEEKLTNVSLIKEMGIKLELGEHNIETFERADLIVLSPGVPHTISPVKKALEKGVPVLGELEIASRFIKEPIVAITGTNGKTTTTELVGKMLKASGLNVFTGGNIGNPLIGYLNKDEKADVLVIEVSSFQLDTTELFRPKVSVLLNITEDHMDRYGTFDAYVKSKASIFRNQKSDDIAVIKGDDLHIKTIIKDIKSKILFFNPPSDNDEGIWIDGSSHPATLLLNTREYKNKKMVLDEVNLMGKHNFENIAASSLAALYAGATFEGIFSALKTFKGLPHRVEYVDTINGVKYYDDSKGTNIDAVLRALEVFNEPIILIMGGRDKGTSFNLIEEIMRKNVKNLIVFGEAKKDIKSALGHVVPTYEASDMTDAVLKASELSNPGDVVLLSPACTSFDMYKNYEERGKDFCRAVYNLKK